MATSGPILLLLLLLLLPCKSAFSFGVVYMRQSDIWQHRRAMRYWQTRFRSY